MLDEDWEWVALHALDAMTLEQRFTFGKDVLRSPRAITASNDEVFVGDYGERCIFVGKFARSKPS